MPVTAQAIFDYPVPEIRQRVTTRDTILYALSVGYGIKPLDPDHLLRTFGPVLRAVPTFANVIAYPGPWLKDAGVDWNGVVHAEQRLELHRPLPLDVDLISTTRMLSIVDKGPEKGMFATFERTIRRADDAQAIATIVHTDACRFDGGCGSAGAAPAPLPRVPTTPPDRTVCVAIPEDAALLYRLNGDLNPLHADPVTARKAGFERPILHGLCTFGYVGYVIADSILQAGFVEPSAMAARFTAPVFPGETLAVDLWTLEPQIRFRARVPERDCVALDCGTAGGAITPADAGST